MIVGLAIEIISLPYPPSATVGHKKQFEKPEVGSTEKAKYHIPQKEETGRVNKEMTSVFLGSFVIFFMKLICGFNSFDQSLWLTNLVLKTNTWNSSYLAGKTGQGTDNTATLMIPVETLMASCIIPFAFPTLWKGKTCMLHG